jgi:phage terminase small subunit
MHTRTKVLPAQHARFVAEFLKDLNGKQAAIRAGYSPKSAKVTACRLLHKPGIAAAVATQQKCLLDKTGLTGERILEELGRIACFDPVQLLYTAGHKKAGQLKPIHEMDEKTRACIASFEHAAANPRQSHAKRDEKGLYKVKLCDKLRALEMLGKRFGLFDGGRRHDTLDWDALAARLASVRNEAPVAAKTLRDHVSPTVGRRDLNEFFPRADDDLLGKFLFGS